MIICDICGVTLNSNVDRITDGEKFYDACPACKAKLDDQLQANALDMQKVQEAIVKTFVSKK